MNVMIGHRSVHIYEPCGGLMILHRDPILEIWTNTLKFTESNNQSDMTILNLNDTLNFELPFPDGAFDEYIRKIDIPEDEKEVVLSLMGDEFSMELEDLGLDQNNPELFAKLKDIYARMAREAEEKQWLWNGFKDGAFEYDVDELMDHCQASCGFVFEGEPDEFEDEDEYYDARVEAFEEWLEDYLISLDDDEFKEFMYKHLNAHVELDELDFSESGEEEDSIPLTAEEMQAIETRYFEFIEHLMSIGCPHEALAELVGRSVYDYICEYEYSWDDWEMVITGEFQDYYNTFGPSALKYMPDQEKLKAAISQD